MKALNKQNSWKEDHHCTHLLSIFFSPFLRFSSQFHSLSWEKNKKNPNLYLCHTLKIDREDLLVETEREQRRIIFNRQKPPPSEKFVPECRTRESLGPKKKKKVTKSSRAVLFGDELGACASDIQLEIL